MTILRTFTFDRNNLKSTTVASATSVDQHIRLALTAGAELSKVQSNVIGALRNFLGVLRREESATFELTTVGAAFQRIYAQEPGDAWRWLLTRSLWRYVVPNGTASDVNDAANAAGVRFNFFRVMLELCVAMGSQQGERRFVYYDELIPILTDDANWGLSGVQIFQQLLAVRDPAAWPNIAERRRLLDGLEPESAIPRDNLNTVLNKAMQQTGLFDHVRHRGSMVGIALSSNLDPVLQGRVRHVLDNDPVWKP